MKKIFLLILALCCLSPAVFSQTATGQFLHNVKNYLESRELKGVDTSYIGVPQKKWSVFANTYVSQLDFDLRSNVEAEKVVLGQELGRVKVDMYSKVETQASVGLYYMGYGLSYSQDLNKGFKKNWSFTMYSSPLGGEFSYHTTDRIHGKLSAKGLGLEFNIVDGEAKMENFIVNAYYVFNPKKFSYDAAMSYSKIQKKSAGSILGGVTVNQTKLTAYDQVLISLIGGVNKIYLRQFSFGAGYAYNWVPAKGLNVHLSAIPMLLITTKSATKNTGEDWDESQKETQKKLFGSKTHVSYTHMGRFSLSYNLSDKYMVGFSTFYNYFRVGKHSSYYGSTEDWKMRFFVAVRF